MGGEMNLDDVVDEKEWGQDEDDDSKPTDREKETFEKNSAMHGDEIEGEMRTKDDDEQQGDKDESKANDDKKESQKKEPDTQEEQEDDAKDVINDKEEELTRDKPMGVDAPTSKPQEDDEKEEGDEGEGADEAQMMGDESKQETQGDEGGDLPDNMEIDGEDDGIDEGDEGDIQEEAGLSEGEDGDRSEVASENSDGENEDDDAMDVAESRPSGGQNGLNDVNEDPNEADASDEDAMSEQSDEENALDDKRNTKPSRTAVGIYSKTGKDSVLNANEEQQAQNEEEEASKDANDKEASDAKRDEDGEGGNEAGGASGEGKTANSNSADSNAGSAAQQSKANRNNQDETSKDNNSRQQPPNPFRKMGDINKRWHRHLNMDQTNEESNQSKNPLKDDPEVDKDNTYAFESEEGSDAGGGDDEEGPQAMGALNDKDDRHVPLPFTGDGEDEDDGAMDNSADKMDREGKSEKKDSSKSSNNIDIQPDDSSKANNKRKRVDDSEDALDTMTGDTQNNADADDIQEKKSASNEMKETAPGVLVRTTFDWKQTKDMVDDAMEEDEADLTNLGDLVDKKFSRDDFRNWKEQWLRMSAHTLPDCIRLCESLRLILEPTLASRLRGDYRTGKRINMRRVIGYVASGYRKDAIWLRRTKPSKREYQVMVMIDNSRSMADAGPVAMGALNLLTGALTRLEVGEISVCSFADKLYQLHPFGKTLNEEAGAKILSHFDFKEERTLLAASLRSVLPFFQEAKSRSMSSSSAAVLQICFIISDAKIDSDNRENLGRLIREMAEMNVLALLVIIDKNDNAKDSIFATKSVEFTPTGIVTRSYLDNFPFPYYVAIQHTKALPDVLCDAMKQWFELVRMQLDN
jgi:midasin (ATPase involved in ribosome maturation)